MSGSPRLARLVLAVAAGGLGSGCVDVFEGSDIQLTFDEGVFGAAQPGAALRAGQPPTGTFFSIYAIDLQGDRSFAHELTRFEIVPVVDPASPCFIEVENLEAGTYVGLHVTQLAAKLRSDTGISDALNPPAGADPGAVIDILTAERRLSFVPQIEATLRAVVSPTIARRPDVDTGCVGDGSDTSADLVPPPECIDDESNARRMDLCQAFWDRYPGQYEGSDRAYTDPMNGVFYGLVDGINPKNASPLGGVELLLDVDWNGFERLAVNWQYEDADGDGEPDWPDDLPAEERSVLGFHFLEGDALEVKRGAISYPLRNRSYSAISGQATVLHDLGEDDVHF